MPDPKLSLITICKNSGATVAQTIESVLEQKDEGVEYIIVDGASEDNTVEIIRSYGEQIDAFITEPDAGISDAFNKGLSLASGEIIGFLNSDDRLVDGALQKVRKYFSDHPNIEVLHGDILSYEKGVFLKRISPSIFWWAPWRLVLFNHPATYVRAQVYSRLGGFSGDFRFAMDDELFLRWRERGVAVEYMKEPLVAMEAGGLSGRYVDQVILEKRRALLRHDYPAWLVNLQFVGRWLLVRLLKVTSSLSRLTASRGPR